MQDPTGDSDSTWPRVRGWFSLPRLRRSPLHSSDPFEQLVAPVVFEIEMKHRKERRALFTYASLLIFTGLLGLVNATASDRVVIAMVFYVLTLHPAHLSLRHLFPENQSSCDCERTCSPIF